MCSDPEQTYSKDTKRAVETYRRPPANVLVFLGIDVRQTSSTPETDLQSGSASYIDLSNPPGTPYFAIDAGAEEWQVGDGEWGDARSSASSMSGWEAGVFAQARALVDWNVRNKVSELYMFR